MPAKKRKNFDLCHCQRAIKKSRKNIALIKRTGKRRDRKSAHQNGSKTDTVRKKTHSNLSQENIPSEIADSKTSNAEKKKARKFSTHDRILAEKVQSKKRSPRGGGGIGKSAN